MFAHWWPMIEVHLSLVITAPRGRCVEGRKYPIEAFAELVSPLPAGMRENVEFVFLYRP